MAVDARETAQSRGLFINSPDRPDFHLAVVDYVVRQYPQPDAEVPRDSVVYVWFDFGEGDGGAVCASRASPGRRAAECSASWTSRRATRSSRR